MRADLTVLIVITLITGCASDHDLKRNGPNFFGGGYIDDELGIGLYSVKGFSNYPPLSTPDSAYKTFANRSEALCKGIGYKIINANHGAYATSTPGTPPLPIIFIAGNILCADSPITLEEAKKLLSLE